MEEIITIILILLSILLIFCLHKILDKRGLYFAIIILNLLAFVLSFKITYAFKMNVNIGIIPLISSFSILYIIITKYGYNEIKSIIKLTLYTNITTALLLTVMNYYIPAATETISINMQGTFEYNYKILIVFPIMVLLCQYIISKVYEIITKLQSNITLSIILTHIITSIIYIIIFYSIIYINTMEFKYSLFLGVSTYVLALPISIIHIIFIYFINRKKVIK